MKSFIDSHTHLEVFHRKGILDEILQRAEDANVGGFITVGTGPGDWELYRRLAEQYQGRVFYTAGMHPCDIGENWEQNLDLLRRFFEGSCRPVAVGEIGLDRFHLSHDPDEAATEFSRQRAAFRAQLEIARTLDLPVVIHSRGAFMECVAMIDESGFPWRKVVFHCFSEGPQSMGQLMERGGRGSFTGILTYKNAEAVREAALCQGIDQLMIETDAPYLAPVPHRGNPNEPAYLRATAEFAADLFHVSLEELAARTAAATAAFYSLPNA